jgi:hypothetical protein
MPSGPARRRLERALPRRRLSRGRKARRIRSAVTLFAFMPRSPAVPRGHESWRNACGCSSMLSVFCF